MRVEHFGPGLDEQLQDEGGPAAVVHRLLARFFDEIDKALPKTDGVDLRLGQSLQKRVAKLP